MKRMKKLQLNRDTIRSLTSPYLESVHGGVLIPAPIHTMVCPVQTNGCTGGSCQITIGSGTSVINPSGGSAASGG
jgi:hypothetical protein